MNFIIRIYRAIVVILREIVAERRMRHSCAERMGHGKRRGGGNRDKDILGEKGEVLAVEFLQAHGCRILARNLVMPSCELDIVAREKESDLLLFIEVKTRRSRRWGEPWQSVNYRRKVRMVRAAREYLRETGQPQREVRFDIISIVWPEEGDPQIEHRKNAFDIHHL